MKIFENVSFFAQSLCGYASLCVNSDTPDVVKQEIDTANLNSLKNDHDMEQFTIIRRTCRTTRTDDDKFCTRSTFENAIEIYPPVPCAIPRYYVKPYDHKKTAYCCKILASTFDRIKAIDICNRNEDSFVTHRNGTILYTNKN